MSDPKPSPSTERNDMMLLAVCVTVGAVIGLSLGSAALGAAAGAAVAAGMSHVMRQRQHPHRA